MSQKQKLENQLKMKNFVNWKRYKQIDNHRIKQYSTHSFKTIFLFCECWLHLLFFVIPDILTNSWLLQLSPTKRIHIIIFINIIIDHALSTK